MMTNPMATSSTPDLSIEAKAAAIHRISDVFTHPDDLHTKFPAFKAKISTERASVEVQLKSALESLLEDAQRGLNVLDSSQKETETVKTNMSGIQSLLADAHNSIDNYSKIMQISKTHQNFVATGEMVMQFQALNRQLSRIKESIDQDFQDLLGSHANMLFVHHQLQQLQEFRCLTVIHAKGSSADVMGTLNNYFRKIDEMSESFENYLWWIAKNTLTICKAGNTSTVVRLIKIIENEESLDEELAAKELEMASSPSHSVSRQPKGYRIKYFDVLREGIIESFDSLYNKYKGDLTQFLEGVDVVIEDLIIIHDELVPRFPKRYNIFQFFVLEYHRITYEVMNRITSAPMEGGAILQLLEWVKDYYSNMNGRLGVGEELLEPQLLDGREEELIAQYIRIVRSKLIEWLKTLLERETAEFLAREYAPETDAEGLYILSGSVVLFQMFNQQVDVVLSSNRGSLLADILIECANRMEEYQKHWSEVIENEFKKFDSKNPSLNQGLPEYLVALANNCYRSTEYAEELVNKIENVADEPYKTQMIEKFRSSTDGFMKLAKKAYTILIDIIIIDIKPATSQMYLQAWYEQNLMRLIIGTFEDYCSDFQEHLVSHLFTKLINELLDRYVLVSLEMFRNKGGKFRMPTAADQMKKDLNLAIEFFSSHKQEKRVRQTLDVIQKLIVFIESNPRMAFVEFYNIWKVYQDVPYSYIEDLVWKRDDLEKAEAKEILESVKDKIKEMEESKGEPPAGLFSKLSKKNTWL